jgi:hypothetical protein
MVIKNKIPAIVVGLAAIAGCLLAPSYANAQSADRERGAILLGTFITNRNTNARVDSNSGNPGTDVDLENELGLDSSTSVMRASGYFWLSRRQRLDVSYFDLSRSASRKIDETINFDDKTFQINTVVSTENHLTITKLDYTFAFLTRDNWFVGVTGGLYVARTGLSLSEPTLGTYSSETLTAPLPVVGFRGEYGINDHWTLRGAFQWFGITTDNISGHLTDTYAGVDYGFGKRFAVGLAYDKVGMGVEASKPGKLNGSLDWGYDGWLLYFKADFGGGVSKR